MTYTNNAPTRRALLGGGALAAATVLSVGYASAQINDRPNGRLRRAIALYDRADEACATFDTEVETPARQACAAAISQYQHELAPPHEQAATTFVNAFGDTVRLTTDSIGGAAVARKVVNDPTWADMGDEDWRQAHREIAAAHDRRDAVIAAQAARKRAFESETRAKFRLGQIVDRSSTLDDRRYRLWRAVLSEPAASLPDVVTKLNFIARTISDDEVGQDELAVVAADVCRLAGEA